MQRFRENFKNYPKKNCSNKGRQEDNLSLEQKEGLNSLVKRVREGEIVICQTDKT